MHTLEDLRRHALSIFDAAVEAADPAKALRKQLGARPMPAPAEGGRTILVAIGKAAPAMLAEALSHVQGPYEALAITHYENETEVPGATVLRAAHPVPDENGLKATQRAMDLLSSATEKDQVIALISGGGSALAPAPVDGVSLQDKARVNQLLLSSGLDIVKMNLVRQQLSRLKGGGVLRLAAPASVTAYILSDVIGDDLRAVAGGPTVGPIGTASDARDICVAAGIWGQMPASAVAHLTSEATDHETAGQAVNVLIGSNRVSLNAALEAAGSDFDARIVSDELVGDVGDAAEQVISAALSHRSDAPTALLFGGEVTVNIRGTGLGGRNQEIALRIAAAVDRLGEDQNWVFLSGGTDGRDGPTEAAGGIVSGKTAKAIADNGGNLGALLANNDSNAALALADALVTTGATGTNVADIAVFLWDGQS